MRVRRVVRHLLPAVLLCVLVSGCIDFPLPFIGVEDAGPYWEQAKPDALLAGTWDRLDDEGKPTGATVSFGEKDGSQEFRTTARAEEGAEEKPAAQLLGVVRTLRVGLHDCLMWKPAPEMLGDDEKERPEFPKDFCVLARYAFEKDVLAFYVLKQGVLEKAFADQRWEGVLVRRKEPDAKADDKDAARDKPPGEGEPKKENEGDIWMTKLTEKSLEFLKTLADDADNWESTGRYTRAKPAPQGEAPPPAP